MGHGSVASNIPECATTDHIASDDRFSPLVAMHIHNSTAFFELAQPYYGMAKMMKVCAIDAISQSCPHHNKMFVMLSHTKEMRGGYDEEHRSLQHQSFQPQRAYNPNTLRNHPGFSWSNPIGAANPQNFGNRGSPPGFQRQSNYRGAPPQQFGHNQGFQGSHSQPRPQLPTLEAPPPPIWEAMMQMMLKSQLQSEERYKQMSEKIDQLSAHNKMLERQIANQASTSSTKVTGKSPACPENPREHVNAIVTRSSKKLEEPPLQVDKPRPSKIINVETEEKLEEEEANSPVLNLSHQSHEKDEREKPERKVFKRISTNQHHICNLFNKKT
nr:uncharacterized protein LOC109152581 [Ipomoea batatas]